MAQPIEYSGKRSKGMLTMPAWASTTPRAAVSMPATTRPAQQMPAYQPRAMQSKYHGQGKIGSIPRTQYYLASSGDYTPGGLRQIYQTPTTLATAAELGIDPVYKGQAGGDYDPRTNRVRILEGASPLISNYIMRHEYGHVFDRNPAGSPTYLSSSNDFQKDFDESNTIMPYAPGRTDVNEARATVSAEPWMFRGVSQYFPEFNPQAWNKPGRRSLLVWEPEKPLPRMSDRLMGLRDWYLSVLAGPRESNPMPGFTGKP